MATMDFFGHQRRAHTASKWLVLLFVAAVLCIIACLYAVAVALFAVAGEGHDTGPWQPTILLVVSGGVVAIVGIAMVFKTSQLAAGGAKVAEMLGGSRVDPGTTEAKDRMLHNVVEEMAIASGIPVPAVYVLRQERGLNAFAAGWGTRDAAITVTQGLLDQLSRDELQGVIAHEFSHVFHGDMRLNIRLMGVLFGIVCIATIGRIVVQVTGRSGRGSRKGNGGAIVVFGLAMLVIGWIGVFFARLIQAAISRQREFLADASAVQYTRNPGGIGMALAKIGGLGAQLRSAHADEASHMMFADGVKRFLGGAFATHPPIAERVERVLPGFTAELRKHRGGGSMTAAVAAIAPPAGTAGFAGGPVATDAFVGSIGDPQPEHVHAARELMDGLPLELLSATRDPERAGALALGLLLERDRHGRDAQLAATPGADHRNLKAARLLAPSLAELPRRARLPLLELAIGTLRSLPPDERRLLLQQANALAAADGTITPFEFALLKTLERHVPVGETHRPGRRSRPTSLLQHPQPVRVVLSTLAWAGADGHEERARAAFAAGWAALGVETSHGLLDRERCSIRDLGPGLDALTTLSVVGKRNLLAACAATAAADGILEADETDLLRALAELWECPVPLLTGEVRPA